MNLLETLGEAPVEFAICTTYPFEPLFFSNYAINPLQDAGVVKPVVLMDGNRYETLADRGKLSTRAIGRDYYLEPVTANEVFHPKVNFLAGDDSCRVSVGSANLTLGEYTTAAQLTGTEMFTLDSPSESIDALSSVAVVQEVRSYIASLVNNYVSGHDASSQATRALSATEWVTELPRPPNPTTTFLHNLDEPILGQIHSHIGDVSKVTLFAPFFGGSSALGQIAEEFQAEQYDILVAEGTTHLDPTNAKTAFGNRLRFRPLKHETGRWIHAKGIVFEGPWGTATLYGSPNVSGQALCKTIESGNAEAALLYIDSEDDSTSPSLWNQDDFPAQPGDPCDPSDLELVSYAETTDTDSTDSPTISLEDVRIERYNNEGVIARFVAPDIPTGTEVTVESSSECVEREWPAPASNGEDTQGVLLFLPDGWARSIVRLETPKGQSNHRQITTEPSAGTREATGVLRSGGTEGIKSLIDESIFLGRGIASGAIDQATTLLSERQQRESVSAETEEADAIPDADSDIDTRWAGTVNRISSNRRKPHLELRDGMRFSRSQLKRGLDEDPTPSAAQDLLAHFDNLWYYITRGLIRSALAPQLQEVEDDSEPYESAINIERLHSICVNELEVVVANDFLSKMACYITCLDEVDSTVDLTLDEDRLLDVFVIYPATIFVTMEWHKEAFIDRFRFFRQYHDGLTDATPLIAEFLIEGASLSAHMEKFEESLINQIADFSEYIGHPIELPGSLMPGLGLLLYGFWYREIAQKHGSELFPDEKIIDQYGSKELSTMASIALCGNEKVRHEPEYEFLRKGVYDPTTRLITKHLNPTPQLKSLRDLDS
jgi:hypothetical protein